MFVIKKLRITITKNFKTGFNVTLINVFLLNSKVLGNSRCRRVTTNSLFDFVIDKYCLVPQQNNSAASSQTLANMIAPPESLKDPIHIPQMRLLMGPGPSNVSDRVLKAQALPTLGHLHPEFCKVSSMSIPTIMGTIPLLNLAD